MTIKSKTLTLWGAGLVSFIVGAAAAVYFTALNTHEMDDVIQADVIAPSEQSSTLSGAYLASRLAQQHKNINSASDYMEQTLQFDGANEALLYEALRVFVASNDMAQAVDVAKKMLEAKSQDPLVAMVLLSDSVKREDVAMAKEALALETQTGMYQLIKPLFEQWVAVIEQGKNPSNPTQSMKNVMTKIGFLESFFRYQMALMNDVADNVEEAKKHYDALDDTPYRIMQASVNFYARQGEMEKAQQIFDGYAALNQDSYLVRRPPEALSKPENIEPLIRTVQDGVAEMFFTTASLFFGENMGQDALLYLRLALHLREDFPPAQMMLANMFEEYEDYNTAIAIYRSMRAGTIFHDRAKIRMALNYEALGKTTKAIGLLKELAREDVTDYEPLISLGDAHRSNKNYEKARIAYDKAIERQKQVTGEDADWSLYYARGMCSERLGEWEKAEKDFLRALSLEKNQPDVLNYLGYSWLVQKINVTQAKQYIHMALDERPYDAHIIDSMGWAYYMTGEWQKAVEYLERAVDLRPQDATINDHLGDAYYRVGREVEASFQWQRALTFEPEEKDAMLIQQKLLEGLPAVDESTIVRETADKDTVVKTDIEKPDTAVE